MTKGSQPCNVLGGAVQAEGAVLRQKQAMTLPRDRSEGQCWGNTKNQEPGCLKAHAEEGQTSKEEVPGGEGRRDLTRYRNEQAVERT